MRLPEEFPHLLAPFLISLSPTDPGSHYPSPLIVLHDNWLLLQLMYFVTRHRDRWTDTETFQGRRRRRVGGLCGAASENRTQFILVFLSPDSLLAGHLILPVSVVDGGGKAVFDRSCWLARDAWDNLHILGWMINSQVHGVGVDFPALVLQKYIVKVIICLL